jgi:hypothetical protein
MSTLHPDDRPPAGAGQHAPSPFVPRFHALVAPGERARRATRRGRSGLYATSTTANPFPVAGPFVIRGRATRRGLDDDGETRIAGRVRRGGIVGTHAGDRIGEVALAIEMGADAVDIGRTIHPHPTLSESVGLAAEAFEGVCTDLPPPRRKA